MLGSPTPGTTYRQEWWLGEAEDATTVLSVDARVKIGLGHFEGCVWRGNLWAALIGHSLTNVIGLALAMVR